MELWQRVIKHESTHLISLKANLLLMFIVFIFKQEATVLPACLRCAFVCPACSQS